MSYAVGYNKSLHLQLLTTSHFNRGKEGYDFNSPYWNIEYRKPDGHITYYEDMVIDLLKRDVTHELFGLNYWDLVRLDIPTFNRIRKEILDICIAREKAREELEKQQQKMQEDLKKQQGMK